MSNNSSNTGDQWDPRFILDYEGGKPRRVQAKFIEAATHYKRTVDTVVLDSDGKLK